MNETHFTSAPEFLEHLRLTARRWGRAPASTWIFRGHGDATWNLLPKAWRTPRHELLQRLSGQYENALLELAPKLVSLVKYILGPERLQFVNQIGETTLPSNVVTAFVQTIIEIHAVEHFADLADNVGLRIPYSQSLPLSTYLSNLAALHLDEVLNGDNRWLAAPPLDDIFGLAQHHGVPTRLLDFTRRPFVAAFFAAQSPVGENIAVWAIDTAILRATRIQMLTCRRHDNSFLHAQDGLFLWDREANLDYMATGMWPHLQSTLAGIEKKLALELVRKVTLPASQARRLMRLLWRERISLPHMMPTYDNIANALPTYWDLLDSVGES